MPLITLRPGFTGLMRLMRYDVMSTVPVSNRSRGYALTIQYTAKFIGQAFH
eukprot:SAG11_NODE_1870_length_4151_cov_2.279368_2_plen_51_part_00